MAWMRGSSAIMRRQKAVVGAPDRIRTCDPGIRNPVLYPTELRARAHGYSSAAAPMPAAGLPGAALGLGRGRCPALTRPPASTGWAPVPTLRLGDGTLVALAGIVVPAERRRRPRERIGLVAGRRGVRGADGRPRPRSPPAAAGRAGRGTAARLAGDAGRGGPRLGGAGAGDRLGAPAAGGGGPRRRRGGVGRRCQRAVRCPRRAR